MADINGTSALTLPKITSSSAGVKYKMYPTSLSGDTTLTADTYLMDANCDCNSYKLTFNCNDGNIVVKRSGDYYHTEQGAVDTTNSSATNKVYWTVKNDDTIGTTLPGSTGSPAVSGGSWGNGTAIGATIVITLKYWEIRWIDNKNFMTFQHSQAIKTIENLTLKNCAYTTSIKFIDTSAWGNGTSVSIFKYIYADNTNTFTSTSMLAWLNFNCTIDYIYVQTANTAGRDATAKEGVLATHGSYNNQRTFTYLNISNAGGPGFNFWNAQSSQTFTFNHCKCCIKTSTWENFKNTVVVKNCVFTQTDNYLAGLYFHKGSSGYNAFRIFNCIFKGFTNYVIGYSGASPIAYIEACRNNIFDSNAKIVQGALSGIYGVKNNGYYNNTSEANWTRGSYDETIAATSYSNWTTGTLHTDWLLYGPGDGWKCNTADITNHCDTNSFCGINTSTQSHTGSQETATTQALGLAPVFSSFS